MKNMLSMLPIRIQRPELLSSKSLQVIEGYFRYDYSLKDVMVVLFEAGHEPEIIGKHSPDAIDAFAELLNLQAALAEVLTTIKNSRTGAPTLIKALEEAIFKLNQAIKE